MFLGVAEDGGKEVVIRAVGYKLTLQVQHGMSFRHAQHLPDFFTGLYGADALFSAFHLNLVRPAEYVEKGLVLEFAVAETRKVYVGKVIQVVEDGDFVDKPQSFKVYAT